jgi:hypothetical protein
MCSARPNRVYPAPAADEITVLTKPRLLFTATGMKKVGFDMVM